MEPTLVEHKLRLHFKGRLLALPANIRLGWKWVTGQNTSAYYTTILITIINVLKYRPLTTTNGNRLL
jgi:hypothetical protein